MAAITLKPVKSSQIKSIGYDEASRELLVKFHNGGVYSYSLVPADVYEKLVASESIGKAFGSLIRKGGYAYNAIPQEKKEDATT